MINSSTPPAWPGMNVLPLGEFHWPQVGRDFAIAWVGWALAILASLGPAAAACAPGSSIADWIFGGGRCLTATTYGAETAVTAPILVVVVHGGISGGGAGACH